MPEDSVEVVSLPEHPGKETSGDKSGRTVWRRLEEPRCLVKVKEGLPVRLQCIKERQVVD